MAPRPVSLAFAEIASGWPAVLPPAWRRCERGAGRCLRRSWATKAAVKPGSFGADFDDSADTHVRESLGSSSSAFVGPLAQPRGSNPEPAGGLGERVPSAAGAWEAARGTGRTSGRAADALIGKVARGSDFGGLARYLTGKKDRVAFVKLQNVASLDVREAAKEM